MSTETTQALCEEVEEALIEEIVETEQSISKPYKQLAQTRFNSLQSSKQPLAIIAREVVSGVWGDGASRIRKLRQAGYDPDEVLAKIDEMFGEFKGPFQPYSVVSKVTSLNVRKGPSLDHFIVYVLVEDKTHYMIVEEEKDSEGNVWGLLRSGLGWINLEYTDRV